MADIRKLFPYIRPYLPALFAALILLTGSGLLEATIVMMLEPVFNLMSSAGFGAPVAVAPRFGFLQDWLGLYGDGALARIALFLILFSFLKGVFLYCSEYLMVYAGQSVVAALRKRLFGHLLDQSLVFFSANSTGQLIARVISDTERLQEAVSNKFADFFRQVILLLAFLGIVFYIDWKLSLLTFLIAPVVLLITVNLGRRVRKLSWKSQQNISDLSNALQETITGQRIVKTFGMESYERNRFDRLTDRLVGLNLRTTRLTALNSPLMEFMGYLLFAPFLLYASFRITQGASVGAFVSFVVTLFKLYEPIRKLSRMHLEFQQAFACSSRIFELLATPVEVIDRAGAVEMPALRSEIAFERVSFQYDDGKELPVLRSVDLTIRKGEIVALVGGSGAGKTTLASLIPRFYDVTEGCIRIDGTDIRDVTQESLRRWISIVSQDTFLFNDTLRANIAYGREACSMEEIREAARAAFVEEFVETLPEGYETVIGERGQLLSGGQRQRIAIARAILKQAPILILDEATSSLDSASERLVQQALQNLMKNCTTLVIAHRLSTVRRADRIVVLEAGSIVEIGSHDSLMAGSGIYRRLYDLQFEDKRAAAG